MIRHRFRTWISTRVLAIATGAAVGALMASVCPAAASPAKPAPGAGAPPVAPTSASPEKKPAPKSAEPSPASLPPGGVTPAHVQRAIEKAQAWFLAHQNKEGNWEEVQRPEHPKEGEGVTDLKSRQWGGLSSLATYALLASGMDPRTPQLQRATGFLLHANITSIYGLGLSSQIVDYLPVKDSTDLVKRNVQLLLAGMYQPTAATLRQPQSWRKDVGFYHYWVGDENISTKATFSTQLNPKTIGGPQPKGGFDRSNSQYGVLGMWALAEIGGEVPTLYWQIVDAAWRRAQLRDGGWRYNDEQDNPAATPSMTAAGVATLFITQDYVSEQNWGECKGGMKDENIERGLAWMDHHIEQAMGSGLYTMYGIERIGTASGRKYFGTADWYKIGMDHLVRTQKPDGTWGGSYGAIPDTAFALVFLSRGRAPVLMNKLEYGTVKPGDKTPEPWDERPRDIANLAKFVGHENETYLNWQVVNLKVSPEELHDAPILYLAGNDKLEFTKEEQDKLRTYVNEGGMILGNDDCGKGHFTKAFMDLGKKLFPNPQYAWKQTAPGDFFYNEQFKNFRYKPKVMELSNGVRKLMALIPEADPSRAWQTKSSGTKEDLFGLGDNIFLYAVDKKNLMNKGDTYLVAVNEKITPIKTMKVARLDVGENPDPEPAGWPRMAAIMHNSHKMTLQVAPVKPTALAPSAAGSGQAGFKVADLTGTGKISLSPSDRTALKQFVDGGGTLIVDAAGGDPAFADSAEQEISEAFPSAKLDLLSPENPVYREPGATPARIGWRTFAIDKITDKHHAKLRGITVGNRVGVFFSREDLSAGIVGEPVDGIYGYDPATATDLMAAMLIYADSGGVAPAVKPPETASREEAGAEK